MNLLDPPEGALVHAHRKGLPLPATSALRWLRFAALNTLRNRRRSTVTVSIAALGTAAILLAGGFALFTYQGLAQISARTTGHLIVGKPEQFQRDEDTPLQHGLDDVTAIKARLLADRAVLHVLPRVEFSGLISNGDKSTVMLATGIDPDAEFAVKGPFLRVLAGDVLASGRPNTVMLGEGLARSLKAAPGGSLTLLASTTEGALNALDVDTAEALRMELAVLACDASVKAVVLTGAGERAFIAGADIAHMRDLGPMAAKVWGELGHECARLLETMPKPTIAAINGFALGGGCETAMACTIRIAVETAKFGQPEVALGLIPGGGGTQRLPRLVGKGRALQLILSGEMISAQEAYRIGLVNELVPASDLITRAEAILKKIAANALFKAGLAYYKQAKKAEYDQNVAAQAITTFTDFIAIYPNDPRAAQARLGYAIALASLGRYREARDWLLSHRVPVTDPFVRAMLWGSLWDLVREAELDPARYVEAALAARVGEHSEVERRKRAGEQEPAQPDALLEFVPCRRRNVHDRSRHRFEDLGRVAAGDRWYGAAAISKRGFDDRRTTNRL
jgi:enoyl-CoA hydratase/carnithine racemase